MVISMDHAEALILSRDTTATLIPAGEEQILKAGTAVTISQALGGTVTIRTRSGLYRLASKDWDALGEATQRALEAATEAARKDAATEAASFSEEQVWHAMRQCFDPEIPVNIVDLGLIYDLQIKPAATAGLHDIEVKMTLTAQGCGMGPVIAGDARERIENLAGVASARVDIVWDPPWTPHMISAEGRQKLGLE